MTHYGHDPYALARQRAGSAWNAQVRRAYDAGHGSLVAQFAPRHAIGWRALDSCTERLKAALDKLEPAKVERGSEVVDNRS